tara:strand:+ start:163 stop:489 length:327 start_codon:yes stop_codon:yes gene_type:complete
MSAFAVGSDEEERKCSSYATSAIITDKEIEEVIHETLNEENKPSELHLQDKIEDLEFELDCYKENNKDIEKRIRALRLLLNAFDYSRFSGDNKVYLTKIIQKMKYLIT